ncbi:hypothetical protein QZH41_013229, partial [Actinostola sp. cb2023]
IVVSLVVAEETNEEKHDEKKDEHHEDEHDEEHEKITPKDHEEHEDDHEDKKDDDHHDDDHDDKKDDDHHDDDHDDKKDDDHHDDDHDDKKDDDHHDDDHDDKKDADDDEGEHDDPKDDDDDEEDSNDGGDSSNAEHDAFLGEHLKAFQDLQDEDAKKKKLQELVVNEIDTNKDGFVTEDEIRARLINTTKQQRKHEINTTMITHDDDKDGKVSWEEFKKHHFTQETDEDKEQMQEDEEKFKHADVNGDGGLDLSEYMSFYHPGDDERMSAFVIGHTLKKYDTDKDGALSKEEFFNSYKDLNTEAKTELEKDFINTYDTNKDGKLEVEEMKRWLFPDEDMPHEEPPALMKEVDDDKDGKLSMDEILKNYKVFVDDPLDGDNGHDEL